jgi:hypothetical protein
MPASEEKKTKVVEEKLEDNGERPLVVVCEGSPADEAVIIRRILLNLDFRYMLFSLCLIVNSQNVELILMVT